MQFPDIPKGESNYMKFQKGENQFRILGDLIEGHEFWKDNKPVRKKIGEKIDQQELAGNPLRYFWALPVWSYADKRVQVLEITQKSVQKEIKSLGTDADWGDPKGYDIVITRTGEGMETEYSVKPKPAKELDKAIADEWAAISKGLNLEALFDGGDPFEKVEEPF